MSKDETKQDENKPVEKVTNDENQQENKETLPPFQILKQFVGDLSLEVKDAPNVFRNIRNLNPQLDVDVESQSLSGRDVLVTVFIQINGLAQMEDEDGEMKDITAYIAELKQSVVVRINDVPKEAVASLVMVEIPTLIYPMARANMQFMVRESGFVTPQLPLINFLNLARNKAEQAKAESEGQGKA